MVLDDLQRWIKAEITLLLGSTGARQMQIAVMEKDQIIFLQDLFGCAKIETIQ